MSIITRRSQKDREPWTRSSLYNRGPAGTAAFCGRDNRKRKSDQSACRAPDGEYTPVWKVKKRPVWNLCTDGGAEDYKKIGESRVYKTGSRVLAVLESDAVFVNQTGYTVRCDEVREQIRDSLKIREDDREESFSEIESGVLAGYYSKWNLKRSALPVVKAGSTFEFVLSR